MKKGTELKPGPRQNKVTIRHNVNAAVFLDRDGTIIEDRGHLRKPFEVAFLPEALEERD